MIYFLQDIDNIQETSVKCNEIITCDIYQLYEPMSYVQDELYQIYDSWKMKKMMQFIKYRIYGIPKS